jgi:pimeloyl-ACP methyl ester carboxylesterase
MIQGQYANVNGLRMYYEVDGQGQPLVLLHGGLGTIGMFEQILPGLAKNRQVRRRIAGSRAHGRHRSTVVL